MLHNELKEGYVIMKYRRVIDWERFVEVVNKNEIGDQIHYALHIVSTFYGDLQIDDVIMSLKTSNSFLNRDIDWERLLI